MKRVVIIFSLIIFASITALAQNGQNDTGSASETDIPPINPPIHPSQTMRTIKPSIQVYQNISEIEIDFLITIENAQIVIKNDMDAILYDKTLNVYVGDTILINSTDWTSGTFSIQIIKPNGEYKLFHIQL